MKKNKGNIVWGLSLIIGSLLILAQVMGYLPENLNWFKLALSAGMFVSALFNLFRKRISSSILYVTFGIILCRNELGITINYSMIFLIGVLLASGVGLIFNEKLVVIHGNTEEFDFYESNSQGNHHISSVFGSRSRSIQNSFIAYLKVESVFSSLDIFLDSSNINDGCTLEIENVFSKTKIYVANNVRVISNTQNVFAKVSNQTIDHINRPTLYIQGDNVFGKIEIIYI